MKYRNEKTGRERLTAGLKERIVKLAIVMTKHLRVPLCAAAVAVFTLTAASGTLAASSPRAQGAGSLSGTALTSIGQLMVNANVQLRELETGQLAATTKTTPGGAFSFPVVRPGQYVVEIVNAVGEVMGTSAPLVVRAGTPLTGVTVVESRESQDAGGAAGAASGGHMKTIVIISSVAAAAAVITAVSVSGSASPSR
jgi:hypothetical protein